MKRTKGSKLNDSAWDFTVRLPKYTLYTYVFIFVIAGFLVNQFLMARMTLGLSPMSSATGSVNQLTSMKFTPFDVALAKERMDENNDGICDVCGMPIEQCIDSGQMDCNMANNPEAMGVLGTAHNHADITVFINGLQYDFAKPEYYMKSSLLHVDNNQNIKDAGSVLHMHAKNVPMWLFFKSLGMELTKDSLTLIDGEALKNENGNTLKFYVNGKKVDELVNYVFEPLDKLLISFGPENDPNLETQINSVPSFAKDHQK